MLALFSNFDDAFGAIGDIKQYKVPGVSVDDVTVISPIEHPRIDEVLGERPCHVSKFTLTGAICGIVFGFLFLAASQASFLVQPQGGKPVIPIPSNIVLTYEMMIMGSVLFTLAGLMIGGRLIRRRRGMYSEKVTLDQVGLEMELEEKYMEPVKKVFKDHMAIEIREEGRS